ncbi:rhomboid family intramembrane serine protease [Calidifontibacillus oryziterrae]|uniref:rhomboid family intramembrane serine protease n=1 Tax=Calidifontibacillus oryziterrae TaxID=1191699 RepID=UPI0002DB556E|nr:rhomboid family intramembrane serine protease [Calidifontibacillus oryziterrae]
MFIRTENFRTFVHSYPIVTTIVVLHLLLWFIISYVPGGILLLELGIGSNFDVSNGEYWRIITSIFLHGGFGHMLFNSFSLVLFGPALEIMLGKVKFILIYLIGGIIANIGTYIVESANYLHLGSSSAIFALFGIYLYMVIYRKDLIDRMNSQVIISILVIGFAMTIFKSNVNISAHIFGLIGGAALAPIMLKNASRYY